MLPLSEAGGALSGANFGVFYTVLMQVGYKHFAPRVLEQLNKGMSLVDALMQVQEELRPFNNRIIVDAIDRLPTMLDLTARMLEKFIQDSAGQGSKNIAHGLEDIGAGLKDIIADLFPSLPEAGAHTGNGGVDLSKPSTIKGLTVAQAQQQARDKQAEHERQLREKSKFSTELAKTKQPVAQLRLGFTKKRKAGQSQIMERLKLIKNIASATKQSSDLISRRGTGVSNPYVISVRRNQQLLVNLLARYSF